MHRVRMGASTAKPPLQLIVDKKEGVLEYVLEPNGLWKEYLGDRAVVPIIEISGPDKESIALHVQELRDKLGFYSSHNIHIRHCRWFGPKKLHIALTASSKDYRPGRVPLADTLLSILDDNLYAPEWVRQTREVTPELELGVAEAEE